jgi:hypothetical protein
VVGQELQVAMAARAATVFLIYQLTQLVIKSPPMVVVVALGHLVILERQEVLEEVGTGQQEMVVQQPKEVSQASVGQLYLETAGEQVIVPLPPVVVVEGPRPRVRPVQDLRLEVTAAMELVIQ